MTKLKKIVCFANSRKHSGRCVAGKEILANGEPGKWIRPVSARETREVSEEERRYENGTSPKVLDVITIPVIGPSPQLFQSENYVIDAKYYWGNDGRLKWEEIAHFVDEPTAIWENGDSTYYGLNDRVKVDVAAKLKTSLMLVRPTDLTIRVLTEGAEFGNPRRRLRADFHHLGAQHSLIVTDPEAEKALLAKPNADYKIKDAYLCISLGEAHSDGSCYKLVAAVITKKPL